MKKTTFLKTLLMAVGLCMGVNAWAGDVSTIYERGQSTAWSTDDYTTTSLTANKWYSAGTGNTGISIATVDKVNYLHISARGKTTTGTSTLTLSRTANTIVTIDAVMNTGSSTFPSNDNRITFKYGAFTLNYYTRYSNAEYYINSTKTNLPTLANDIDLTIHLVVNSVDGKISALKVTRGDTSADIIDIKTADEKAFVDGTNYDVAIFEAYCNVSSNNTSANMKSFVVQQETQDVETANVTFKYEDTAGNSLSTYKSDQVLEDVALGATISTLVASPYTDTFYNGTSNKYVYSGTYVVTGGYTTVQEGGNTVTLKFTDYPATAYTVMAQAGGSDLTSIASGTAYLDGSTTATYSKYVKHGGSWYVTSSPYGVAISATTTNVAYTAANDVYDFIECESTSYSSAGDYTGAVYSNGKSVLLNNGKAMTTKSKITAGVYDFSIYNTVRRANEDRLKLQYSTDGSDWTDVTTLTFPSNDGTTQTAEKVVLAEDSYIRFLDVAEQNSCHLYDYILIKKSAQSTTIGATGYATFSSTYALDFTDVTALEAYTATVYNGSYVTMSKVTGTVAANTGLVLVGESADIPVVASGDAQAGNLLVACSSETTITPSATGTNYVLSVQGDNVVFAPVTDDNATVAAGHAFLYVPSADARTLSIVFADDETTSISDASRLMDNGYMRNDNFFNLNGQRVEKPAKGLYIVNGKKVVVK